MTSRLILRITGFILMILTGYPLLTLTIFQRFEEPRRYHYYYVSPSSGIGDLLPVLTPILCLGLLMAAFSFCPRRKVSPEQWLMRIVGVAIFIMPFVPAFTPTVAGWTFYTPYSSIDLSSTEESSPFFPSTGSITVHLFGLAVLGLGFIGRTASDPVGPNLPTETGII